MIMVQEPISAKQFYKMYSKDEFEEYYFSHTKAELFEHFNINHGVFDTVKAYYNIPNKPLSNKKQNTVKTITTTYTREQFVEYFETHSLEEIYVHFNISRSVLYKVKKYWQIPDKTKAQKEQINMRRYGVINPSLLPEVKAKFEETMLNTYGSVNYGQSESAKIHRKEQQAAARATCLVKYGNEYYQCTEEAKARAHETKKRNNSYAKSSFEELFFQLVSEQITKEAIIRQYRDAARYPFSCDFYIPALDLFVEINAHLTHGGHPFDSCSEADQKQLEHWKNVQEEHPVYKSAIEVWTYRDPLKMKIAKDNNLNYVCLYNKQQIRNFAKGLSEILKTIKAKGRLIS